MPQSHVVSSMVIAIHSREEVSQRTVSASAESGITFNSVTQGLASADISAVSGEV